jgi:hypothetical protein
MPYCCRVQEIADQLLGHASPSVDVHRRWLSSTCWQPSHGLLAMTYPTSLARERA